LSLDDDLSFPYTSNVPRGRRLPPANWQRDLGRQIVAAREAVGISNQQGLLEAVTEVRRRRPGREDKTVSPGTIVRAEKGGNVSTDLLEDIRLALNAHLRVQLSPPGTETRNTPDDEAPAEASSSRSRASKGGIVHMMEAVPDSELFGRLYGFWWSQENRQQREELLGLCERYVKGDPSVVKLARGSREKKESA
jgi:hypothetical protein